MTNGIYGSYTDNEKEFELAVLKFDEKGENQIAYDTPITNDVIGHLEEKEVEKILQKIKKLNGKISPSPLISPTVVLLIVCVSILLILDFIILYLFFS